MRALVVDDSTTVRMDLADLLEDAGIEAVLAKTGADAREKLARETFALVILDVRLPDDDGVEILRHIRADPALAPTAVMLLSSEAEVADRIRGIENGADEYVGKPYDAAYLIARARELVTRARTHDAARTTILVIDDSSTFREELKVRLAGAGYAVIAAGTGEAGLALAASARPNAIVVDGVMPGIGGAAVIRRIRLDVALRHTPCVLLTGSEGSDAEVRALDAGADAFVRKDEELEVLLARLATMLRSASVPAIEASVPSALGPKKLLAVDDDADFLDVLGAVFRADGYEVVLAKSGEDAIDLLAVDKIDCIMLDVTMPGLGGIETCRRIKSTPLTRDVPVVFLTSGDDREATLAGLAAGADDFMSKGADIAVLKARVTAQIRRKQFEDEGRAMREALLRKEMEAAEMRAAHELAETRARLLNDLEHKNRELEAFSYSVSHDLRAPLRSIDGFSRALIEDHASELNPIALAHLQRVVAATKRMEELIEDLLKLSRVGRREIVRERVNLSAIARSVFDELRAKEPARSATFESAAELWCEADARLVRVLFENLIGNAWKFTSKTPAAAIELGADTIDGAHTYVVRDNGIGFDMASAKKLFVPFQRMHRAADFPGTGVGLSTVSRIVERHGGRIWADAAIGRGASFFFTLPPIANDRESPVDAEAD